MQLPLWRRCLQFRLRTLLILVTLSACSIAGFLRYHRLSRASDYHQQMLLNSTSHQSFLQSVSFFVPREHWDHLEERITFHRSQLEECRAAYWRPWRHIPSQETVPPPRKSDADQAS